jgi:hypothetical protein
VTGIKNISDRREKHQDIVPIHYVTASFLPAQQLPAALGVL